MDIQPCVEQFMQDSVPPELLSTALPDAAASAVVDCLKNEADRYWFIDPNRSLELADRIMAVGRARGDADQTALGLMARGDALKFLGRPHEAWTMLEEAGTMFQAVGNEVGWARTRIGRLHLGVKLNRLDETLADVERARQIFISWGESEKLLRLDFQTAIVYNYLGDQHRALQLFQSALDLAATLGEAGRKYSGHLNSNIGYTYEALGDLRMALTYYDRARGYLVDAKEARNIALLDTNIAYVARSQGHYRRALDTLHRVLDEAGQFPLEELGAKSDMVECYLYLNRYAEARDMARQVIAAYHANEDAHALARTLLHLTAAEAGLSSFAAAQAALDEAEPIFASLGASRWVVTTHLLRGRLALKQGDAAAAYREAVAAAASFESGGQQVDYATAALLKGQALFALGDTEAAAQAAARSLGIAQQNGLPAIRYSSHVLLGRIMQARDRTPRALRHYQAAMATVERVQRGMSITLRPAFLEDKGEALRSLLMLHFRLGRTADAFETLERAKSQLLLGYLANRENFVWATDDARSQTLMQQLNNLRAEHQWYYRLAHEPPGREDRPGALPPEQARLEVAARERQMRAITEQLYLRSADDRHGGRLPTTSLSEIQRSLPEGTCLVEFYNDGVDVWAFTLDGKAIDVRRLPVTVEALDQLLAQLQANMGAALRMDSTSVQSRRLTVLAQRILQRLYSLLIEPLRLRPREPRRLVIVPYGALHYLPFHLLYDGSSYLIEQLEVVVLPAAGLATRPAPRRAPGALVLVHSWEGRLPHTLAEGRIVQRLFDGSLQAEDMASRAALGASPTQILHIAAHGEHRLDQPDLSYLQLADGQVYADDILQQDLSYELVTLSACETGRARVAAGDELIGLGRGFLYAGAGALLVSLWPVVDASTMYFMERTYQALIAGASKAAALRAAQRGSLSENRDLHPAFWGAFELIGDASPLSILSGSISTKGA